jgi:hypothetical protein
MDHRVKPSGDAECGGGSSILEIRVNRSVNRQPIPRTAPLFVIAGLDPAIHGELHVSMDHRVEPGGDAECDDGHVKLKSA